jgi:hypothetical protein
LRLPPLQEALVFLDIRWSLIQANRITQSESAREKSGIWSIEGSE